MLAEITVELGAAVARAQAAGVPEQAIWIDPGIGFGKDHDHNLRILAELDSLKTRLGLKLLVGTSRKSFIGQTLSLPSPADRLSGSLATVAIASWLGADAVRVHDVRDSLQVVRMVEAIRRARAVETETARSDIRG